MTYAVHTEPCTYLLDEEGVCRWIVSAKGLLEDATSDCVGAQFVACMDMTEPGGLVAELRVGGMALFVRADVEGRLVLLRTRTITHVESRAVVPEDPPTTRMPPKPPPSRRWAEETITLPKALYRVPAVERETTAASRTPPRPRAPAAPPMRVVPPSMTPARVAAPPARAVPVRVPPPPPPRKSKGPPDSRRRR